MDEGVFFGCNSLTLIINRRTVPQRVYGKGESPKEIRESVFGHATTLQVPASAIPAYRNSPVWRDFENIIAIPD
jgi:hypothetical protein